MSKHMAGFLTRGYGNKPSALGSQHQNQGFTALPFSLVPFILPRTNFPMCFLVFDFPQDISRSKVNIALRPQGQKVEMITLGGATSNHFHSLSFRNAAKLKPWSSITPSHEPFHRTTFHILEHFARNVWGNLSTESKYADGKQAQ